MTAATARAEVSPANLAALRVERNRFVALAFSWAELLFELDASLRIVFAAGPTRTLIGRDPGALTGTMFRDLISADDRAFFEQSFTAGLRHRRLEPVPLRLAGPGGAPLAVVAAGYRLDDLRSHIFVAVRRTISAGERDPASGLIDGAAFASLIATRGETGALESGQRMTLLDAAGYQDVQDRLGAAAEGELQSRIGALLKASSVDGVSAARLTGHRYGVLHDDHTDVGSLRSALDEVIRGADPVGVGAQVEAASVDISSDITQTGDIAKGLVYAINKFRSAKNDDFSLTALCENLAGLADQTMAAVATFKQCLQDGGYHVAFHPIVDVRSGTIHHYEALARFPAANPAESPFETIRLAEETGLIVAFDLAMTRRIVDYLAGMPRSSDIRIAVNISGVSVAAPEYLPQLQALLEMNPGARGRLMFEITESARMDHLGSANTMIQTLRHMGYPVCLDDFGAGAANFQYLSRLEVDIVKLDGSAIRNARSGDKGKAFLRALVGLCREIGVGTIAEMIENESDLRFIRDCGVEYAQGFLFGVPSSDISVFHDQLPSHVFAT